MTHLRPLITESRISAFAKIMALREIGYLPVPGRRTPRPDPRQFYNTLADKGLLNRQPDGTWRWRT